MTLLHFFRQRRLKVEPVEPLFTQARRSSAAGTVSGPGMTQGLPRVLRKILPDKATGSHTIFDLIGTSSADAEKTHASHPVAGSGEARELVSALQAQYWHALDDPQVTLAGKWTDNSGEQALAGAALSSQGMATAPDTGTAEPIETLLSGSRRLEDFFGELGKLGPTFMGIEPVPEILRLFAPPEYRATLVRHPSAVVPPELTRREHHDVSVDSPLRAVMKQPAPAKHPSSSSPGQS